MIENVRASERVRAVEVSNKCDQIRQFFATLAKFEKTWAIFLGFLVFVKRWRIVYAIGQIFSGQKQKK